MQNWRGKCRILSGDGVPERVVIYETDGAVANDVVTASQYSFACLKPPLDELPICSESQSQASA